MIDDSGRAPPRGMGGSGRCCRQPPRLTRGPSGSFHEFLTVADVDAVGQVLGGRSHGLPLEVVDDARSRGGHSLYATDASAGLLFPE